MAGTTVPRGYPYPTYDDTMNFPAQIQALAVALDTDVGFNADRITDARNSPSVRMVTSTGQSLAPNVAATANFTGGTAPYDNAGMANIANGRLEITEPGVYWIAARTTLTAPGSGAAFGYRMSILSNAVLIPQVAVTSRTGSSTHESSNSTSGLYYKASGGTDFITLRVAHSATAARTMTFRNLCATKISNMPGGS